jgi:hypothetical protein
MGRKQKITDNYGRRLDGVKKKKVAINILS